MHLREIGELINTPLSITSHVTLPNALFVRICRHETFLPAELALPVRLVVIAILLRIDR